MTELRFAAFLTLAVLGAAVAKALTIPTVPVGNPGNLADANGLGSVSYSFCIGMTEVTNAQYVEFLNSVDPTGENALGLYEAAMTNNVVGGIHFDGFSVDGMKYQVKPGRDRNPVVYISLYDAVRFANWLHNGQGSGDTETGAYTLGPLRSGVGHGIPVTLAVTRNAGAKWWIPSVDEWHKAAFHQNDGITDSYRQYPTSSDIVPDSAPPPGTAAPVASNTANIFRDDGISNGYNDGYAVTGSSTNTNVNYLTDAGAYSTSIGPYGTFDQAGNAREWTDGPNGPSFNVTPGGAWGGIIPQVGATDTLDTVRQPINADGFQGFRVATIPEPTGISLCVILLLSLEVWRRSKGRKHTEIVPVAT